MKIISHNVEPEIDTTNVKFQGIIDANYKDIVEAFGQPLEGDLYKIDAQWKLKVVSEGGQTYSALLYNFKTGKNYLGKDGLEIQKIPNWNVATSNPHINVADYIEKSIKQMARK